MHHLATFVHVAFLILQLFFSSALDAFEATEVQMGAPLDVRLRDTPSSTVHDCVDAISGSYSQTFLDVQIPGNEGITLEISYSSSDTSVSALGRGVRFHLPSYAIIPCSGQFFSSGSFFSGNPHAFVMHESGSGLWYKRTDLQWSGEKCPTKRSLQKGEWTFVEQSPGLTNFRSEGPNSRTNLKNARLIFDKWKDGPLIWDCGGGTYHSYSRFAGNKYALRYSQKENGNRLYYEWENNLEPKKIISSNRDKSQIYGWIKLEPLYHRLEITTSHGKKINYSFELPNPKKDRHYLKSIQGPDLPDRAFQYTDVPGVGRKLSRLDFPENRCRVIEYYGKDCPNPVMGKDLKIRDKNDPRLGRVRRILEPLGQSNSLVPVASFIYELKKDTGAYKTEVYSGRTQSYDALGNRTDYIFNADLRITELHFFDGNRIKKTKKYFWGENGTDDAANLLGVCECDSSGKAYALTQYKYDSLGNLLEESLFGNIRGNKQDGFSIDANGRVKNCTDQSITRFVYNKQNLLISKTDPSGNIKKYSYKEGTNLPLSELSYSESGKVLKRRFFTYDENSFMTAEIEDDGIRESLTDLSFVTQRKIKRIHYKKDKLFEEKTGLFGLPEAIDELCLAIPGNKEEIQKRITFDYDPQGNILKKEEFSKKLKSKISSEFKYDKKNRKISEIDSRGLSFSWQYDGNDNLIEARGPKKDTITLSKFDHGNRLVEETIQEGSSKKYSKSLGYDAAGNVLSRSDYSGSNTFFTYDCFGRVITETLSPIPVSDEKGERLSSSKKSYSYDIFGNCREKTDPKGNVINTAYNLHGSPLKIYYPDGSQESFSYHTDGKLDIHTLQNGSFKKHVYDDFGNCSKIQQLDRSGTLLNEISRFYTCFKLVKSVNEINVAKNYSYNYAGQLIAETQADEKIEFSYDDWDRISVLKQYYGNGPEDYIQKVHQYDPFHRTIDLQTLDAGGNLQLRESSQYDEMGNKTQEIVYHQNVACKSFMSFDALNRLTSKTDAQGNRWIKAYNESFKNEHGQSVLQMEETDPSGLKTLTIYNSQGLVDTVIKRHKSKRELDKMSYCYDLNGNKTKELHSIFSPEGKISKSINSWSYDSMNRVSSLIEALGSENQKMTRFSYTASGQEASIEKNDGTGIFYSYTAEDYLKSVKSTDGSICYEYTYDPRGRAISAGDSFGITQRQYDSQDRVISESLSNGLCTYYSFDQMGRLINFATAKNGSVQYTYQGALPNTIQRISKNNEPLFFHKDEKFDLAGSLLEEKLCDGTIKTYAIDSRGQLKNIQSKHFSCQMPANAYDSVGNLKSLSLTDSIGHSNREYQYSPLHQLISESGDITHDYLFNSRQQRLKKDNSDYIVESNDRLSSDAVYQYSYDARGNPIKKVSEDKTIHLSFDALDRLVAYEEEGVYQASYTYDAFNRRVATNEKHFIQGYWGTTENLKSTRYHCIGNDEIGSVNENDTYESFRVLRPGQNKRSVLIELMDKSFTPVHDHNGSVAVLVDNYSGTVKESYRYSAYGEEEIFNSSAKRIDHSSISNPWRYGNKRIDEASGLINFGMRYFDPSIGQWLTQDPAGFVDGPNLYAYCYNSPLLFYDPYGLSSLDTAYGLGIGVGNTAYGIASGTVNLGLSLLNSIAHPIDTAETALEFASQCAQIIDERGFEQIKNDLSMEISDSISRYGQRWHNADDKECGIMMGEAGAKIASFLIPIGLAAKAKWASRSASIIKKTASVIKHESKVHKAATISSQASAKLQRSIKTELVSKEGVGQSNGFLGKKGWELKNSKYQNPCNATSQISGREYSAHALDQMQNRGITPTVVEDAIKNGVSSIGKKPGTTAHYSQSNNITVIVSTESGRVVTSSFGRIPQ